MNTNGIFCLWFLTFHFAATDYILQATMARTKFHSIFTCWTGSQATLVQFAACPRYSACFALHLLHIITWPTSLWACIIPGRCKQGGVWCDLVCGYPTLSPWLKTNKPHSQSLSCNQDDIFLNGMLQYHLLYTIYILSLSWNVRRGTYAEG